jgi:threonine dehydratase
MPLVTPGSIDAAGQTLRGVVIHTPLLPAHWLAERVGGPVRLKCENLQRGGSFKIRGAYTLLARLAEAERRAGVITYSSGNHAQALALAASLFGCHAVVVMPTTAPPIKIEGARDLGAEVILEGTTSLERRRRAEELATARGLVMVPPFDHPDIIAGQGTVGAEILDDWADVDLILVPVGGGGLLSGVAAAVRSRYPDVVVVGVEPENAAALRRSLDAGSPVTIEPLATVADGLAPVRPGDLTFLHARELVDDVVTVDEAALLEATRLLQLRSKLVVEFSGAAGVAALLSGCVQTHGRRTAVILSGGNLDPARSRELL